MLVTTRGRDDQYIWSNHGAFDAAFKASLHTALAELAIEPRPSFGELPEGAWAFPCHADKGRQAPALY
jgi:hypothetical protein